MENGRAGRLEISRTLEDFPLCLTITLWANLADFRRFHVHTLPSAGIFHVAPSDMEHGVLGGNTSTSTPSQAWGPDNPHSRLIYDN